MSWRTGRKVGRTIYRMVGDEPSDRDVLIGVMDREVDARAAVQAVNEYPGLVRAAMQYVAEHPERLK